MLADVYLDQAITISLPNGTDVESAEGLLLAKRIFCKMLERRLSEQITADRLEVSVRPLNGGDDL